MYKDDKALHNAIDEWLDMKLGDRQASVLLRGYFKMAFIYAMGLVDYFCSYENHNPIGVKCELCGQDVSLCKCS